MVKTIKIGDKSYNMKSSANTPFRYNELSGNKRDFFEDMDKLVKLQEEIEKGELAIKDFGELLDMIYLLAYTMCCQCGDSKYSSIEDFREDIEDAGNGEWLGEVLTLALSTFPRKV